MENANRVAVVTGASRGIGRAVAVGLARDGFALALVARRREPLDALAADLARAPGVEHSAWALDVADSDAIRAAVAAIATRYGRIDVLVNGAGTYEAGTLGLSGAAFEHTLAVNLVAPFLFMQAALPFMKAQGRGHVFNVASRAGKVGFAGDGVYVASKFGLVGLSESVYREHAAAGICVTSLCPGWTDTDMARAAGTPLSPQEMIQPDDVLETIRWLLRLSPAVRVREVVLECGRSIA